MLIKKFWACCKLSMQESTQLWFHVMRWFRFAHICVRVTIVFMKVMKLNQSVNIFIGNHFHVTVCILIPEILLYFYLNKLSSGLRMCRATWNQFLINNLLMALTVLPLCRQITTTQVSAKIFARKSGNLLYLFVEVHQTFDRRKKGNCSSVSSPYIYGGTAAVYSNQKDFCMLQKDFCML